MSTNDEQRIRIAASPTVQAAIATAGAEIPDAMFPDRWALNVVDAILDAETTPATATKPSVATITTDDEFDEWTEDADEHYYFVTDGRGEGYVLFCNEDGDWYVTRPPTDDDRGEDGTFPGGVTVDAEGLPMPITIQTVQATR